MCPPQEYGNRPYNRLISYRNRFPIVIGVLALQLVGILFKSVFEITLFYSLQRDNTLNSFLDFQLICKTKYQHKQIRIPNLGEVINRFYLFQIRN